MLKKCLIFIFLGILLVVTGCQTVQGIGEDIKWAGEKGQEALEN